MAYLRWSDLQLKQTNRKPNKKPSSSNMYISGAAQNIKMKFCWPWHSSTFSIQTTDAFVTFEILSLGNLGNLRSHILLILKASTALTRGQHMNHLI